MSEAPKQNYLNNRDLLKEIHNSKMSFCWLLDRVRYHDYDIIVDDLSEINEQKLIEAKEFKASQIQKDQYAQAMLDHDKKDYRNKPKQKDFQVDLDTISDEDVVIRVMTYDHIPEDDTRRRNPKTEADERSKVNFPPFKHYAYINGELTEVARSHWKGDLETGEFCAEHGQLTANLGKMFLKLVERYSGRANWRGYSYVDEMRGAALLQLSAVGLKFNEAKSNNPFAYYTAAVNNSFTGVLNQERRNQNIRDDILVEQGHMPSYTRQLAHEDEIRKMREDAEKDSQNEDFEAY